MLFHKLNLPSKKKTKTGYSTDVSVLEELAPLHPVPAKMLEHRSLSKLKSTYVDVLPALGMTQSEFARRLGVSRLTVSELLHEKRALSTEMAARLARLLDTTPESWLGMQTALDLWQIGQDPDCLGGIEPLHHATA